MNVDLEYLEAKVLTARPEQLHLMVVDGALRHCRKADLALAEGSREEVFEQLSLARDYISELIGGLNKEAKTDLVGSMAQLFVFIYRRLVEADIDQSGEKIRDAIHILEMHRHTWKELMESNPTVAEAAERESATLESTVPQPHTPLTPAAPIQAAPINTDDYQPRSWSG